MAHGRQCFGLDRLNGVELKKFFPITASSTTLTSMFSVRLGCVETYLEERVSFYSFFDDDNDSIDYVGCVDHCACSFLTMLVVFSACEPSWKGF
jgi:hypothetical protein